MTTARPVRQWAEPARGWIAFSPRSWRCGPELWTDLAGGRLEGHRPYRPALPDLDVSAVDDLFYLPPVRSELRSDRDRRLAEIVEMEIPVLAQLVPGEDTEVAGVRRVVDLLPLLATGEVDAMREVPEGVEVLWPLVPGLADGLVIQEEGVAILADRGVRNVQVIVPEIPAPLRRRLGEISEDVFDALFHGGSPTERELARLLHAQGIEPFLERTLVGPPRTARNRGIARDFALLGELSVRLGEPVAEAQALLRAARGADATGRDLLALSREGNLRLLDWLDSRTASMIDEIVEEGKLDVLEASKARYLRVREDTFQGSLG